MKDIYQEALELHEKTKGKLEVQLKVPLEESHDLSLAYTPGVAQPCREIAKNKDDVYKYTWKQNSVAVVSDGTAVLGLGDIGPEAAMPVMEGKAVLFKKFGNIDAVPIQKILKKLFVQLKLLHQHLVVLILKILVHHDA